MKTALHGFFVFSAILLICLGFGCEKQEEAVVAEKKAMDDLGLDTIPRVVMDGLTARFPNAEIQKWTREEEDDIFLYDIEFKQDGWKLEADIKEDGSIHNWEKAIKMEDLPEAIKKIVEAKYPKSTIKEIMEVTLVADGKDALEGYEIVLESAGMKEVEVMVAPDGKILEDSGESKENEE
ncbi:MAG: PepSY-like domain-containing protein [Candidatus Eisenbacteria bacterium]